MPDTITISAVPLSYSLTASDTITLDTSNITVPNGGYMYTGNSGTITLSGSSASTYTIGGAGSGFSWNVPQEWDGCFPDWDRIQTMCDEYPALKIAFEKFKTTYKLVKDLYDTPEDERPIV
jgi:hypothetical protein